MQTSIKKIIAVLNDFSMMDEILGKTFSFAQQYDATVEILYVHESPLFDIPDFFRPDEGGLMVDKEKIKVSILEKIETFDVKKAPVVFVKIDDTPDRVWALAREDRQTFIIAGYHKNITQKLIDKITQQILVIKHNTEKYQKMALIVDAGSLSSRCIEIAKTYFPDIGKELFYDYRYIVNTGMDGSLQNIQIIEEAQREAFEVMKQESGLKGKFFIDGDFLGTQLNEYFQEKDFDILYVCSHEDTFFVSNTLAIELLDTLNCDILVSRR